MTIYAPMLARVFEDVPILGETFVQPKLDGIRCIVQFNSDLGEVVAHSRNGKPLQLPQHIASALYDFYTSRDSLNFDLVFDGELYAHGLSFQEVASRIKRIKSGIHPEVGDIGYHIYDIIDEGPFWSRSAQLDGIYENYRFPDNTVHFVETQSAVTPAGAFVLHKLFVEAGYEGSMLRAPDSLYEQGKRSKGLLKRKDWKEDDFEIVEIDEGIGKNAGTAVCLLKTADNKHFTVTSPGNYTMKTYFWTERQLFLGKKLSVKYQELTDDGIPRFPIALGIKEDR